LLLDKGADVEPDDTMLGYTPLSLAETMGHNAIAENLLKSGAIDA